MHVRAIEADRNAWTDFKGDMNVVIITDWAKWVGGAIQNACADQEFITSRRSYRRGERQGQNSSIAREHRAGDGRFAAAVERAHFVKVQFLSRGCIHSMGDVQHN